MEFCRENDKICEQNMNEELVKWRIVAHSKRAKKDVVIVVGFCDFSFLSPKSSTHTYTQLCAQPEGAEGRRVWKSAENVAQGCNNFVLYAALML